MGSSNKPKEERGKKPGQTKWANVINQEDRCKKQPDINKIVYIDCLCFISELCESVKKWL